MLRGISSRLFSVILVFIAALSAGIYLSHTFKILPDRTIDLNLSTGFFKNSHEYYGTLELFKIQPSVNFLKVKGIFITPRKEISEYYYAICNKNIKNNSFCIGDDVCIYFSYMYTINKKIKELGSSKILWDERARDLQQYVISSNETLLVAQIRFDLLILDSNGNIRLRAGYLRDLESCSGGLLSINESNIAYWIYCGKIPVFLDPGEYEIVVTVEDILTGLKDKDSIKLTIQKG